MSFIVIVMIVIAIVFVLVSIAEFYFQASKKIKERMKTAPKEKEVKTIEIKAKRAKIAKKVEEQCPIREELKGLVKEENYNYDKFNHIETPYEIIEEKCESCGGVLKRGKVFYVCPVCGKRKKIV